ncbi:MAG: bifunctional 4-hydroxy-2-oxoglutarate aldolase/2-dehydro-3-deoxy-phosphogluconate aldolase [Gammaproteobacteria bacterium]|nr:bifunctional 4-hydroxy-2-oxoglutarate aldolase/2-dehydro-3-deoxy-phosphogluconate aldolase [Gammaproteobacteria bacterium]MCB1925948.1 bifunctional 4-hydroxy-2-oxoglutarate aldolase/2-dehydro-3-deoxy-phosphogluconate aldolase [Gammaproteobacteria bacterium]
MNIEDIVTQTPVLPVIVIEQLEYAVPLAQALVSGGIRVLEVTLRTPVALDAVAAIAKHVPDAIVGVGTLTRPEQLVQCVQAGAQFAVSPGLTRDLLNASGQCEIPFLPGVFTPSEAMAARDAGFEYLKLFPAQQAGGIGMLKALASPFAELKFCPTGGVSADNFRDFLALPNVVCVGGSWVAPTQLMQQGDWDGITALASAATAVAR